MIDETRTKEAKNNFSRYLEEGLLKKETNEAAKEKYIENAELSLAVASELMQSSLRPYLWVIVTSYYSMFYAANAVLLNLGYKIQDKIAHKVTNDALIVLVLNKLKLYLINILFYYHGFDGIDFYFLLSLSPIAFYNQFCFKD